MLEVGAEFAGYRIVDRLGQGGMSVVYLAQHLRLERRVALKILTAELGDDATFRERFVRESKLAASLDHPNIVPIYDAGEANGALFIAMRYVEGSDLRVLLEREGRLDPERALSLVAQVASALDAAHDRGLCHRDVKPGNILVVQRRDAQSGEHVYLADFGLTKRSESQSKLTRTGQFMGTLDYVAPEQIQGGPVDGSVDIYSVGCVLYECLTGERPYPKDSEVAVIAAHLWEAPPKLSARRPDLPAAMDGVIATAMAKAKQDRYATAAAVVAAARKALGATIPGADVSAALAAASEATQIVSALAASTGPLVPDVTSPASPPPAPPALASPPTGQSATEPAVPTSSATAPGGSGPPAGPGPLRGPPPGPRSGPPTAGPPAGPPQGDAPFGPPPEPERHERRRALGVPWWRSPRGLAVLGAGVIAAVTVAAILALGVGRGGSHPPPSATSPGTGEIFLQSATTAGRDPFSASVAKQPPAPAATPYATAAVPTPGSPGPSGAQLVSSYQGSVPGLYGGTRSVTSCNSQQLITFLAQNPDKAQAWAGVEGISPADIQAYVRGLTPVLLRADTRVTNHGYSGGRATEYQSVLQAGTAVLIDNFGVPRVRCYCGNPLTKPIPATVTPTYTGDRWPAFQPTTVVVVQPAPQPITTIVIVDVITGNPFARPVGGDGATDTDAPPGVLGTPTPTPAPSPSDITSLGSASASSSFSADFGPEKAVDGDRTTSWFSAGAAEGNDSTYIWSAGRPVVITSVSLLSNSQNRNPAFRRGYTFASVTVQVLDANGTVVASRDAPVQDTDVTVDFGGVTGSKVVAILHDHLNPACGGISEFIVRGHLA